MRQPCALLTLVNEINDLSQHGLGSLVSNDILRRKAIDATRRLNLLVQTPEEAVRSLAFSVTQSDLGRPYTVAYMNPSQHTMPVSG